MPIIVIDKTQNREYIDSLKIKTIPTFEVVWKNWEKINKRNSTNYGSALGYWKFVTGQVNPGGI